MRVLSLLFKILVEVFNIPDVDAQLNICVAIILSTEIRIVRYHPLVGAPI